MVTTLLVGTLISSDGSTTDGRTSVLLGTFVPPVTGVTSIILFINGIAGGDTASAVIAVTANSSGLVSRNDLVPLTIGSSTSLSKSKVTVTATVSGIDVSVIGVDSTTINWSVYATGNCTGV